MNKNDFTWKIGGEAGFGIMVTGASFAKICARCNLNLISNTEYPSLIRGGHNIFTVRAATQQIFSLNMKIDVLVTLNKDTMEMDGKELSQDGVIIFDPDDFKPNDDFPKTTNFLPVPFQQLAKDNNGNILMRNTVALGASLAVLGIDFAVLESVLKEQFGKKGQETVDLNSKTAKAGYDYVLNNLKYQTKIVHQVNEDSSKIVLTGNESIGMGAVSSGVKFFSAYPMTPINGLITYMANHDKKFGFVYKQPEDEISAINMAIGASFTGARSMTASSGGGFALMNEAYSMAGMTETPLVVIYGQRPGPASGLPTWTSQADLRYALSAGHGEFLRFVFAPGDTEEAFWLTKLAFNLADKYQTPAMILVDKYLCECLFGQDKAGLLHTDYLPESMVIYAQKYDRGNIDSAPKEDYLRYKITENGISPRALPGAGMSFTVNSYEHDEAGFSTENAEEITKMIDKRQKKAVLANVEAFGPIRYGSKTPEITLIGWGSTKMAAREAIQMLSKKGIESVSYLHFPFLSPFPVTETIKALKDAKTIIDVENNSTGQFADYLREKTGIEIKNKYLKYNGRHIYPEDILNYLTGFGIKI